MELECSTRNVCSDFCPGIIHLFIYISHVTVEGPFWFILYTFVTTLLAFFGQYHMIDIPLIFVDRLWIFYLKMEELDYSSILNLVQNFSAYRSCSSNNNSVKRIEEELAWTLIIVRNWILIMVRMWCPPLVKFSY